jgi:N-acyl-D-aspartate/D-glutamate deacylase
MWLGRVKMLDHAITGGTIIDGSGAPAFRGDIAIKDGLIVEIGTSRIRHRTLCRRRVNRVAGLRRSPPLYDGRLFWDPIASPSNWHGVTIVILGNRGLTLAPLKEGDADYEREMMPLVEGMPLGVLEKGVLWDWEVFGEYVDSLDGHWASPLASGTARFPAVCSATISVVTPRPPSAIGCATSP